MSLKNKWVDASVQSIFTGAMWGAAAGFLTVNALAAAFTAMAVGGYEFYAQSKEINSDSIPNNPS